jgi:hypothetical protein
VSTDQTDLEKFATDIRQEVILISEAEAEERMQPEAFTSLVLDHLIEAAEVDDAQACYHRDRGIEISGYGIDEDEEVVNLFATIYRADVPPTTTTASEIETSLKRLRAFWDRTADSYHLGLEEASDVFEMALRLHDARREATKVRLFVLTDGLVRPIHREPEQVNGLEYSSHVWDIRRLQRCVTSGQRREPIEIDFIDRFGQAIPCLDAHATAGDYEAYMAVIPGEVLNSIYAEYGPRLLELNVRSFLQARGKVNQGIRETILKAPERFLAYNNGISATASAIDLVDIPGGGRGIRAIKDLQIVNGGQTTASIHHAVRRDKADVSKVRVQAKLTVVAERDLPLVVPLISRFANSQNKVSEADFSANDPFHVRVEELSRTIWAPPADGTHRQTKWFYERARGQYADALGREGTPARQRAFKESNPSTQRFTKTDLAKFENTWDQLPHLVSRGAQKNFVEFTERLRNRGKLDADASYFHHLVAKAMMFRKAERLVAAERYGGYRANIVAYTLAYISNRTAQRVDLDGVWRSQDISPAMATAVTQVSRVVHGVITDPPGGGNVTEWCKRPGCWERVQTIQHALPHDLEAELIPLGRSARKVVTGIDAPDAHEVDLIRRVALVPGETWFAISNWARETGNLEPWQRSLAFSLGKLAKQERPPSRKQANQGERLKEEAQRLGFRAPVV